MPITPTKRAPAKIFRPIAGFVIFWVGAMHGPPSIPVLHVTSQETE